MTALRPSTIARAGSTLLGMTLACCTPGILFVAQAIDLLHGQSIATAFHLVLAGWGAFAGVVIVRERFEGRAQSWFWLVPVYAFIYLATGLFDAVVEAARGGREAFAAFVLFGAFTLMLAVASLGVGSVSYWLTRRLASGLLLDAGDADSDAKSAQRSARWLLIASVVQLSTGVFGGPVIGGTIAAASAAWLFFRARHGARWRLGVFAAGCVAIAGASTQASLWASQVNDLRRAALPPCSDSDSESTAVGAYTRRARSVPGVREVSARLRLDLGQSPKVVYRVFVTARAAEAASPADVQRALERALADVDCDEGPQLHRVAPVVRVLSASEPLPDAG